MPGKRPFTFDGRAYERVGPTTRRMVQSTYEALLLARAHATRRWENEPAIGVTIRDIDRTEVYRILEAARAKGHLLEPVGSRVPGILERLEVMRDGLILQAAVVLFGKRFMPDYPQCELRMARFRGHDKTEFLDQLNVRGPAFKLLEAAEIFCRRHLPIPGRIVPGQLQRDDRPLIPPDALREIVVNALIHRDYANAGGAIYLAIFDDRVEIWSTGTFPAGITPAMLTRVHNSILRNPTIADVFNRAGLIEKWGRGTNRVIVLCRKAGIRSPQFEEIAGSAVVTFPVPVGRTDQVTDQVTVQVTDQVRRLLILLNDRALTAAEIMHGLELSHRPTLRTNYLHPAIEAGLIEMTVPGKPNSRLQQYRLSIKGHKAQSEYRGEQTNP